MAQYRAIVEHVRYWRGVIHRWSTSYEYVGSGSTPDAGACAALAAADSKMCYNATTGVTGGIPSVRIYGSSGGVPVAEETFFDYTVPADWVAYNSTGWGTGTRSTLLEPQAEVAVQVSWAAGLSTSGKPVVFRKWYHSVPQSSATAGAVDISPTVVTELETAAAGLVACLSPTYGLVLGNTRRLAATTPIVQPYYGNHQMPRGRRRKALVTASGKYQGPTISGNPLITYGEEN